MCRCQRPQFFEFEVATCRTCRLRSKKANLEVVMSNTEGPRLSSILGLGTNPVT